jgi:hypothetical protein
MDRDSETHISLFETLFLHYPRGNLLYCPHNIFYNDVNSKRELSTRFDMVVGNYSPKEEAPTAMTGRS